VSVKCIENSFCCLSKNSVLCRAQAPSSCMIVKSRIYVASNLNPYNSSTPFLPALGNSTPYRNAWRLMPLEIRSKRNTPNSSSTPWAVLLKFDPIRKHLRVRIHCIQLPLQVLFSTKILKHRISYEIRFEIRGAREVEVIHGHVVCEI
jgi:hypothetical protein